jgi:hypothetical protein
MNAVFFAEKLKIFLVMDLTFQDQALGLALDMIPLVRK